MRVPIAVIIAVIGAVVTYFGATKFAEISEIFLGPTLGAILGIIVACAGVAITIGIVVSVAKREKSTTP